MTYIDVATGTKIVVLGIVEDPGINLILITLSNSSPAFSACNDHGTGYLYPQP